MRGVPYFSTCTLVVLLLAGGLASDAAAQSYGIAGGQKIAVQTARHGWLTGVFQDVHDDTVVLQRAGDERPIQIPYDSVLAWRVPEKRSVRSYLGKGVLGGIVGAMVGVGVGFEGATKVTAPHEVRRDSRRYAVGGVALGLVWGVRRRWHEADVLLVRGGAGEQMLVNQDLRLLRDDGATMRGAIEQPAITRSELEAIPGSTALDAVRRLRPQFLRARRSEVGREALVLPAVYIDGVRVGDLELLETIHLRSVLEIQYFSPTEANMRWGVGHEGGVIHVILRRA
jgi:hypothetical protein